MQSNKNKKKRKLKKGFKLFLWLIFFVIIFILIYLFKDKIISNISKNNITLPKKEEKTLDTTNISTDEFSNLFRMRLPSQNLEYSNSGPIEENGDMKIFLKNTNEGYLYVNTKDDPTYVWITFVSAIVGDPLKSSIINNISKLNYIDLRFGNKVFYKFSNEAILISTSTSKNEDLNKNYLNNTNSSTTR